MLGIWVTSFYVFGPVPIVLSPPVTCPDLSRDPAPGRGVDLPCTKLFSNLKDNVVWTPYCFTVTEKM